MESGAHSTEEIENRGVRLNPIEAERILAEIICGGLLETPPDFGADDDLFEAGLDSMAIMQLIIMIEERFSIQIPAQKVNKENFHSIRSLSRLLCTLSGAGQQSP